MLETLYIRLGSHSQDTIHWLIWANTQQEIIASGTLDNASQLTELTEKSQQRQVVSFIPGCDVAIKSLKVPGNSPKAIRLAAPYMLEDDLAQEVESLFFAYSSIKTNEQGDNCFIAAVYFPADGHWTVTIMIFQYFTELFPSWVLSSSIR